MPATMAMLGFFTLLVDSTGSAMVGSSPASALLMAKCEHALQGPEEGGKCGALGAV